MSRRPISTMTRMRCIHSRRRTGGVLHGPSPDGAGGRSDLPPRNQAHAFYLSPTLRFLALLQPGGLDGTSGSDVESGHQLLESAYHIALSDPPAIELAARYGVKMLTRPKRRNCCLTTPAWGTAKELESLTRKEIADRKDWVA